MQRNRLNCSAAAALAGLAGLLLAVSACSSGTKALTKEAFVAKLDAWCADGEAEFNKLDLADPASVPAVIDVMVAGLSALVKIAPPAELKADFDSLTNNLDDQISQATKMNLAIKSKDDAAASKASDQLDLLGTAFDDLAASLGADACVSEGSDGGSGETSDTSDTGDNTTDTAGANDAEYLSAVLTAPVGYSWEPDQPYDASDLYSLDVLGPTVDHYGVGQLRSAADDSVAEVYIIQINTQWTQDLSDAYLEYEGVLDGTDVTTPGGLKARMQVEAFDGSDSIAFYNGTIGVSIVTATGVDGAAILDAVVSVSGKG
ncbi:MAG: hypothetical protein WCJ32_14400 [Actinomycetota bacterium]